MDMNFPYLILTLMAGFLLGFFTRGFLDRTKFNMTEQASKNFLLIIVAVVWTYAMIIDLNSPNYDVPVAVHGLLAMIVGFFFYRPGMGGGK